MNRLGEACFYVIDDFAGFIGDLLLQRGEAAFEVASLLFDRQEVAGLGVQQEQQSVEEGQGTLEGLPAELLVRL